MKILHTADWHIGKQLYKYSLDQDLELFFNWLVSYIKTESIDILLVSGDVFDLANPSHYSRRMYYGVLKSLISTNVKVVITGGNHDSITNLEASSDLLDLLDIKVVAGMPDNIKDLLFEYTIGSETVTIAAIPFIRDKDIRKGEGNIRSDDRIKATQEGIISIYQSAAQLVLNDPHMNRNTIAMGHLYLQSAKTSESERDIQIGNLAGVSANSLGKLFDYVALGHIHKPQSFLDDNIRYSGSPISLSFSERIDEKQVVLLEIKEGSLRSESIKVPKFRDLIRVSGTLDEVKTKLSMIKSDKVLPAYVEVVIEEKNYSIPTIDQARMLISSYVGLDCQIIKDRITFERSPRSLSNILPDVEIGDLKPEEVFNKKLDAEGIASDQRKDLKICFHELLEKAFED